MIKPLRVTSGTDFQLLGEIDEYTSLRWTRRWQKPGEAELTLNYNLPYADLLVRGNILEYGDLTAIIDNIELKQDDGGRGKETLTVRARSTASIIGRRITKPPAGEANDTVSGAAETVMKAFVSHCFEGVAGFAVAPDRQRGVQTAWETRYDPLDALLEQISIVTGLGWDVRMNAEAGLFVFEVLEGESRVEGSGSPVIFSPDYDNLKVVGYAESDRDYRNVAIVGGQGEGAERTIVTVAAGDPAGLEQREIFVDARDISAAGDLMRRGQQALAQYPLRRTMSAEILTKSTTEYRKDWDLGDVVVVQNTGWGVSMDAQIIEVVETVERNGRQLSAVFGTGELTLAQAIRRETSKANKVVQK